MMVLAVVSFAAMAAEAADLADAAGAEQLNNDIPNQADVAATQKLMQAQQTQMAEWEKNGWAQNDWGTRPAKLYHYTGADPQSIVDSGALKTGNVSGKVYTTPNGDLSPLQAQIDLALQPNRGLPTHLLEIDSIKLQKMGIEIPKPQLVTRMFNMPGGGYEVVFSQRIPSSAITIIR